MKPWIALASLAVIGAAHAQVTQIDIGAGRYVAGASRDNQTWFVKSDGGQGGGFWSGNSFTELKAPEGSQLVIEPMKMSSNGQWIVGNAAYERQGYIIYLPVLWNRQGDPTVLTEDMSFDNAIAVSDDGSKVLMGGLGAGGGVWSNGTITGSIFSQAYDMSADGGVLSYGRDNGYYQEQVVQTVNGVTQLSNVTPNGGGVSGNGKRIFAYGVEGENRNYLVEVGSNSVSTTALDISRPGLGSRGLVSYNGAIASAGDAGYWTEALGMGSIKNFGLQNHVVTAVSQDDRHIFVRNTANGMDYMVEVAAVPEPGTLAALALGGWFLRRRRK